MIRIRNVTKTYRTRGRSVRALENISLDLPDRGFVALCGENGCGKTTLPNAISTLDPDFSGEITIDMTRVTGKVKQIICIVLFLCIFLFSFSSCAHSKQPQYEKYDKFFLNTFTWKDSIDMRHISKLTVFYYENTYYYLVQFLKDSDDFEYEILYIFENEDLVKYYSIKNPEECMEYFPDSYQNFLTAKKNGEKKEYTEEEIQSMIDKYKVNAGEAKE